MDLLKFQASIDAHTAALNTHSATMEKFMAVAASGGASSGEATAARGRGRPTNAEKAAQAATAATPSTTVSTQVAATGLAASSVSSALAGATQAAAAAQTAAVAAAQTNATVASSSAGPLTHQSLAPKVVAFAKSKGRDALVALLGEFGAAEFAKVPVDQLPLFNDRLDGKPQTPTIAADLGNLLGM